MRVTGVSDEFKFTDRHRSKSGIAAFILGVLCLLGFPALIFVSVSVKENSPLWVGALGIVAALVGVNGVILAFFGLRHKDTYKGFPVLGMLVSLLGLCLWAGVYMLGQ